jgi:hypothetical protein
VFPSFYLLSAAADHEPTESRTKENLSECTAHVPGMGSFTFAGIFFLVMALLLFCYSVRSGGGTDNTLGKFKAIYVLLVLFGIFLIVMDNADLIFPYRD